MKRTGNLWDSLISHENLMRAFLKAIKGKTHRNTVKRLIANPEFFVNEMQRSLINGTYQVSPYKMKHLFRPKFRVIHILPTYPDNIIHHAVLNVRFFPSKVAKDKTCSQIQFILDDVKYVAFTTSEVICKQLQEHKDQLPFLTTIKKRGKYHTLT